MTSAQKVDQMWQEHAEISPVVAAEVQGRILAEWQSPLARLLRRPEQHLGFDGVEAVATPHPVCNLHQPVQGFREGIRADFTVLDGGTA